MILHSIESDERSENARTATLRLTLSAVLVAAMLSACDGGNGLQNPESGNNDQAPASNDFSVLPQSLRSSDAAGSDASAESTSEPATFESPADSLVQTSIAQTDSLEGISVTDYSQPHSIMLQDAFLLDMRLFMTGELISTVESVQDQIDNSCSSIPDGEVCSLAAGSIEWPESHGGTIQVLTVDTSDPLFDPALESESPTEVVEPARPTNGEGEVDIPPAEGEIVTDDLAPVPHYLAGSTVEYIRNPAEGYSRQIVVVHEDDGYSDSQLLRWNDDRTQIVSTNTGSWSFDGYSGDYNSDLRHIVDANGSTTTLLEEGGSGDHTFSDLYQLRSLDDGRNGIELHAESTWRSMYENGSVQSSVVANDDGGQSSTVSTIESDGTTYIFQSRSEFNRHGELTLSQYCDSSTGADCSDPANWLTQDPETIVEESEFVIDESLLASEDELQSSLIDACLELGEPEENCLITRPVVIDGTSSVYDNVDDLREVFCEEEGLEPAECEDVVVISVEGDSNGETVTISGEQPAETGLSDSQLAEFQECFDAKLQTLGLDLTTLSDDNLTEAQLVQIETAERECLALLEK